MLNLHEYERLSVNGRKIHSNRFNWKLAAAGIAHLNVLKCYTRTGGGLLGGMHNDTDDHYKRAMNQAPPQMLRQASVDSFDSDDFYSNRVQVDDVGEGRSAAGGYKPPPFSDFVIENLIQQDAGGVSSNGLLSGSDRESQKQLPAKKQGFSRIPGGTIPTELKMTLVRILERMELYRALSRKDQEKINSLLTQEGVDRLKVIDPVTGYDTTDT